MGLFSLHPYSCCVSVSAAAHSQEAPLTCIPNTLSSPSWRSCAAYGKTLQRDSAGVCPESSASVLSQGEQMLGCVQHCVTHTTQHVTNMAESFTHTYRPQWSLRRTHGGQRKKANHRTTLEREKVSFTDKKMFLWSTCQLILHPLWPLSSGMSMGFMLTLSPSSNHCLTEVLVWCSLVSCKISNDILRYFWSNKNVFVKLVSNHNVSQLPLIKWAKLSS